MLPLAPLYTTGLHYTRCGWVRQESQRRGGRSEDTEVGGALYLTESPDGFRLTPYDPEFAEQMEAAEAIMKRRRDVLRELTK